MNITIVNSHPKYLIGGAELFMFYCALEFIKKGHNVKMISVYPKGLKINIPSGIEILNGITVYHLADMETDLRSAFKFIKILCAVKTDVYLKMFTDPSTVLLAGYALLKKIPYVLFMAHDAFCEKDAGISVAARYKVSSWTKFFMVTMGLYGWSLRHAKSFLAQNNRQKDLLLKNYSISVNDVIKIGHPVPEDVGTKVNPLIIIWSARFQPWKKIEIFLDLARRMPQYKFVIGGPTADESRTEYFKNVAKKVEKIVNVSFSTFPDNFDEFLRFPLYQKASIFVDTIDVGGFENTLVQAMLRKIPIVSYNRNFDGVLEKEGIGFSCDSDIEYMVEKIDFLMNNSVELESMGERARNYAKREYNIEPIADKILTHLL